jgi:phosphoglycerol transferase MdoB-like AlkP superfamily enzyme
MLNKKTPDGQEITPFLNTLQSQSVHVDRFYSNSIQTAKGHFSILFSTIPSIVGKEANKFTAIHLNSLATVLKDQGYTTTYFGAHRSKRFDNNYNFFTTHGFQKFVTSKSFSKPEDAEFSNHWGPQDTVFFKRYFEYFDNESTANSSPQFVMLTTIYNHFPFNFLPEDQKLLYHGKTSFQQDYENSVHLTDKGIQLFFDELNKRPELKKKTLVIIVGDHGFPLGEHGNYSLPAGYHEESFRVPFFMVYGDKLSPRQIKGVFSQMDIAPTVLDVLGIKNVQTNFQGTSILGNPPSYIFLIQPYERQLSLIHFPYKFLLDTRLNKEYLYDLQNDPMEKNDISASINPDQKRQYESQIRRILLNQKSFESDQFWPK